jgi:hypothetical protein
MNDTDAQTKGRSPDEVSPAATALKEARAVMARSNRGFRCLNSSL